MRNLGKVYTWYFGLLTTIGQMSNQDKDEEEILMNPGRIEEIQRIKEERAETKRQKLLDENYILQKEKGFFEN